MEFHAQTRCGSSSSALGDIGAGRPVGPALEKTTFEHLAQMLLDDYQANARRSLPRAVSAVAHLRVAFGFSRALDITADRITTYTAQRQKAQAKPATVNRELSALKRMFRLGQRAGKVGERPYIAMLRENNVRKGFFEAEQWAAVAPHLSADLRPVFETVYLTGWRVKSELLTRQRHHVDLAAGWLRLEPGETKNTEGRMFPLTPRLRAVLEAQLAHIHAVEMLPPRGRDRLSDGGPSGPHPPRLSPARRAQPRARGRAALDGDGDGRTSDRGDLSPVRDRGRAHAP